MDPWSKAITEAGKDAPSTLEEAVRSEVTLLWNDLSYAVRTAANGTWSMECDNLVRRIVRLSRISGYWEHWEEIQYNLLRSGIWQKITKEAGADIPIPHESMFRVITSP